jgi:hypothetical protein
MRRRPMHRSKFRRRVAGVLLVMMMGMVIVVPSSAADPPLPSISYSVDGITGNNGWYRGSTHGNNIVLHWTVTGATSVPQGECQPAVTFAGPSPGFTQTCSATNDAGTISVTTKMLKIDADPPTGVSASFARAADFNGWFNHPVTVTWQGSDATSGIASCSAATYAGPDKASAPIGGGCADVAGNVAAAPVSINYDATAPVLSKASVDSRNGADVVSWKSSSPSDTAVVQRWQRGTKSRPVVFRGAGGSFMDKKVAAGLEYTYAVQTFDEAGNASKRVLVAGLAKIVTMRKLPYVPRVADQPILRWAAVKGARYYNVQLYRGSKRVYAAWPTTNKLGLPAAWRWNGKRHRLSPGKYRWYVWAGFGARSFARYRTVGSAQFVVPK